MKVLVKKVNEILSKDLSLEERGLLITIIILKDSDPAITLAKVKAKTEFLKNRDLICSLQEKGFVKWSGYTAFIKSKEAKKINPHIVEVITYLNNMYGTRFNPKSKTVSSNLKSRLEEYSIDEIKKVIANRYMEWKDDSLMKKYLTPYTIFRPSKFEKYLEEANRTRAGEGIVTADKLELSKGDSITRAIAKKLVKNDVYQFKVYSIINGKESSSGKIVKLLGSAMNSIFAAQEMSKNMGDEITEKYYYEGY